MGRAWGGRALARIFSPPVASPLLLRGFLLARFREGSPSLDGLSLGMMRETLLLSLRRDGCCRLPRGGWGFGGWDLRWDKDYHPLILGHLATLAPLLPFLPEARASSTCSPGCRPPSAFCSPWALGSLRGAGSRGWGPFGEQVRGSWPLCDGGRWRIGSSRGCFQNRRRRSERLLASSL